MSTKTNIVSVISKLSSNQKKFAVELIPIFIVVVLAIGSVVLDAKMSGVLGLIFIAFAPFVGVALGVHLFGKISLAHFNPAVTIGFLITKHISKKSIITYLSAEMTGTLLGSIFVKYVRGTEADLGANSPNYSYSLPIIFGVEVLASALLMTMILLIVYSKGLKGFG